MGSAAPAGKETLVRWGVDDTIRRLGCAVMPSVAGCSSGI